MSQGILEKRKRTRVLSIGLFFGFLAVVAVSLALVPLRDYLNSTSIALALLLCVTIVAAHYGQYAGVISAITAVLLFNFLFLLPYHTFTIADSQNWIALLVFLIVSLIAGGMSAREKQRTIEARERTQKIELLNRELQQALSKAMHADDLEQSEKLKTALLDAVTHELRTPITSMKAAVTSLLTAPNLSEEGKKEMLDVIREETDRLNHLVNGLISIAQLEAGGMYPQRSWTQLDDIITNAISLAGKVMSHHILKLNLQKNLPPIRVDEKAIAEVFQVLFQNAAKYSPEGTTITITGLIRENQIEIMIDDEGAGVPPELRERVFEKFFRIPVKEKGLSGYEGLGMGLAIARGIVESHKGAIRIENNPAGHGARIVFTIPLHSGEETVTSGSLYE